MVGEDASLAPMKCHAPSYITLGAILVKYSVPWGRVIAERKVIYRFSAHNIHQLDSSILLDEAERIDGKI